MKFSELKRIVPVAEEREKVPTLAGVLASGASIVAKDLIDEETDVTVFSNGYVLYQRGCGTQRYRGQHGRKAEADLG